MAEEILEKHKLLRRWKQAGFFRSKILLVCCLGSSEFLKVVLSVVLGVLWDGKSPHKDLSFRPVAGI